jgi:uncharacterized protein (TIGR00299 family) protein
VRARLLDPQPQPPGRADDSKARAVGDLIEEVDAANLPYRVKMTARMVLIRLGEAEAAAHGIDRGDLTGVMLHELGDDDTLLDVVGVAVALEGLGIEKMFVSSVPLALGDGAHGTPMRSSRGEGSATLPPLAPATLDLLRGFTIRGEGSGELVTPTAAAIFAAVGLPSDRIPTMTVDAVGYGAGTRDPADRANVVRVIIGYEVAAERESAVPGSPLEDQPLQQELVVLEANLDDLTAELVADAASALLAGGALDVWTTPVHMKKGRAGVVLAALAEPAYEARLRQMFFESTSTFGVRVSRVRRTELERRLVDVPLRDGVIRVKVGLLAGRVMSVTPEHDDVAELAGRTGLPARLVYEEALAAARELRFQGKGG